MKSPFLAVHFVPTCVALSFPIDTFHDNYFLRNQHTYTMINASNKVIRVEF